MHPADVFDPSDPAETPDQWAAKVRTRAAVAAEPAMIDTRPAALVAVNSTPEESEPIPETAEDRVARLLFSIGDDPSASVRVYRIKDTSRTLSWCENYSPSEFEAGDFGMIRRKWGPGRYEIRLYRASGIVGRQIIEIEDDGTRAAEPVAAAVQSEVSAVLKAMQESQAQMMAALTQRPDPMAQISQTVALIASMKEVFGASNAGKSQISEIVAAVRELREVSEEINPKPETEEQGLMGTLAPILAMIAQGQQAQQAQQIQQAPAPIMPPVSVPASLRPAPIPTPAPAPAPNPTPTSAPVVGVAPVLPSDPENMSPNQLIQFTRAELLALVQMAATNGDPEDGAARVYEVLPDDAVPLLLAPNWFDLVCQLVPEAAQHREWMTKARDIAAQWFAEDEAEDAENAEDEAGGTVSAVTPPASPNSTTPPAA